MGIEDYNDIAKENVFKILREYPEYKHYEDETLRSLIETITEEFDYQIKNVVHDEIETKRLQEYPYWEFLKDSKFYPLEENTQEGCDTCNNEAEYQTFVDEDNDGEAETLYLACEQCINKFNLPCD